MTRTLTDMLDDYKNRKYRERNIDGINTASVIAEKIVLHILEHGQFGHDVGHDDGQPAFWLVPDETEESNL